MSKGKKTFFIKVSGAGGINTEKSTKQFTDFLGEDTTPVSKPTLETKQDSEHRPQHEVVAEAVFGIFDKLEEDVESRKSQIVEEEHPITFTTQKEVDGFNDLSDILHSDDVAGTMLEQLTGDKLDLDEEDTPHGLKTDPPQAVQQEEIDIVSPEVRELEESINQEIETDPTMSQYVDRVRLSSKGVQFDLAEQDLQNTPASIADLQKATQKMMQNIQTSLTSLGGGGLGEPDVVRLIKQNSTNLSDSDLDYIASQIDDEFTDSAEVILLINEHVPQIVDSAYVNALVDGTQLDSSDYQAIADRIDDEFTDSAEVLLLINETVDSAYISALIEANDIDSAHVVGIVQPMIDSAIAEEHQFNVDDHAEIRSELDSAIDAEHAFNVAEHNKLQSDFDSAIAAEHDFNVTAHGELDSSITNGLASLDSAITEEHNFNLVDHALIRSELDSAIQAEHAFNVAEHAALDSAIGAVQGDLSSLGTYTTANFNDDLATKSTDDLYEGTTNLYHTSARVTSVVDSIRDDAWFTGQLATNSLSGLQDVHYDSLVVDQILVWNGSVWQNEYYPTPPKIFNYHGLIDCTTDSAPAAPDNGDTYLNTGSGAVLATGNWTGLTTVDSDFYVIYDGDHAQWDAFTMGGGGVSAVREGFGINVIGSPSQPTVEVDSADLHTFLADKDENDSDHAQFRSDLTQLRDDHDSDTLALNTEVGNKVSKTGDTMTGRLAFDRGVGEVIKINPADGTNAIIDLFQGGNNTLTYTDLRLSGATFRNVFRVMGGPSPHEEIMSIPSDASGVTINSVTVTGQTELNAKLTLNNSAEITGDVDIGGELDVTGLSTFLSNVTIKNGNNLRVVDAGEVSSNTYNSVGNSNVSLKRNNETNLQLLGQTTRAQKVVDYSNAAQSRIYSDSAVADTFLTHKGYVTDALGDLRTSVDSDFNNSLSTKVNKSGDTMTGNLTIPSHALVTNEVKSNGNSNLSIKRNNDTKIQITSSENKQFQKAKYNSDYGVSADLDIPHKKYVDDAIDTAITSGAYVNIDGSSTMTGNLKTPRVELDSLKFNASSVQKAIIENTAVRIEFNNKVIVKRGGTNDASGFTIQGKNAFGNAGELLAVQHNSSGHDEINYTGIQTKDHNLSTVKFTKEYVTEALESLSPGGDVDNVSGLLPYGSLEIASDATAPASGKMSFQNNDPGTCEYIRLSKTDKDGVVQDYKFNLDSVLSFRVNDVITSQSVSVTFSVRIDGVIDKGSYIELAIDGRDCLARGRDGNYVHAPSAFYVTSAWAEVLIMGTQLTTMDDIFEMRDDAGRIGAYSTYSLSTSTGDGIAGAGAGLFYLVNSLTNPTAIRFCINDKYNGGFRVSDASGNPSMSLPAGMSGKIILYKQHSSDRSKIPMAMYGFDSLLQNTSKNSVTLRNGGSSSSIDKLWQHQTMSLTNSASDFYYMQISFQ